MRMQATAQKRHEGTQLPQLWHPEHDAKNLHTLTYRICM